MTQQHGAARPVVIGVAALLIAAALGTALFLLAGGGPGGAPPRAPLADGGAGRSPAAGPDAQGPAGAGAGAGTRPGETQGMPAEVLAAIRGGPLPVVRTVTAIPDGDDWRVTPLPDEAGGLLAKRGRADATGASAGDTSGDAGAGPDPAAVEAARRQAWVARQERRNDLRVAVMKSEVGLTDSQATAMREALSAFVAGKVALFESIGDRGSKDPRISIGLEALRADLAQRLTSALGPRDYTTYTTFDAAGKFALPEEKRKP